MNGSASASPGSPVALHEAPGPCHVHRVPRISEPVVLKLDPRLVASRFAVALDDHTVETGIAENVRRLKKAIDQEEWGWYHLHSRLKRTW